MPTPLRPGPFGGGIVPASSRAGGVVGTASRLRSAHEPNLLPCMLAFAIHGKGAVDVCLAITASVTAGGIACKGRER